MLYLMSSSVILCENFIFFNDESCCKVRGRRGLPLHRRSPGFLLQFGGRRLGCCGGFVTRATGNGGRKQSGAKRGWWWRFFFEEGDWFGLREDDVTEDEALEDSSGEVLSEEERFEAWKRRAEAIVELREAQEDMLNEESRRWEDWIVDDGLYRRDHAHGSWSSLDESDGNGKIGGSVEDVQSDPLELVPRKGFVQSVSDFVFGEEDDMLYEDRVFRFASSSSAKFLAVLILIPWVLDFVVHDYVLMPFLDRYVNTVPLAAQMLDVRRSQKLMMVKELNAERARYRFEVEIGKSPPLSEDQVWWELRHKALELRDELRLENRKAFANIWSDMVFGISLFVLLIFNPSKVAMLKFTGYKVINNISDAGKAFLIILVCDISLGYHSEYGWMAVVEIVVDHYGLQVDQGAVDIFIGLFPVALDTCIKLWLFKYLPRISRRVAAIVNEMERH